jgi:hypothetical protein
LIAVGDVGREDRALQSMFEAGLDFQQSILAAGSQGYADAFAP